MLAFFYHVVCNNQLSSTVALPLSWAGYRRVSDMMGLRWKNIALPVDVGVYQFGDDDVGGFTIINAKDDRIQFEMLRYIIMRLYNRS